MLAQEWHVAMMRIAKARTTRHSPGKDLESDNLRIGRLCCKSVEQTKADSRDGWTVSQCYFVVDFQIIQREREMSVARRLTCNLPNDQERPISTGSSDGPTGNENPNTDCQHEGDDVDTGLFGSPTTALDVSIFDRVRVIMS